MNGGAPGRRKLAATDMATAPATDGDWKDYAAIAESETAESWQLWQELATSVPLWTTIAIRCRAISASCSASNTPSSGGLVDACAADAELCINPIVYTEVSVGFERIEELDDALSADVFTRLELPWEAAFLAGKAFLQYRRARGERTSPLPDFCIGAHAAIDGMAADTGCEALSHVLSEA